MNRKGVCYDVGRVMMGSNWRPKFDKRVVHRELEITRKRAFREQTQPR